LLIDGIHATYTSAHMKTQDKELPAAFVKMLSTYVRFSSLATNPVFINGYECSMPFMADTECLKRNPVLLGGKVKSLDCSGCTSGA
jgi:hypothetical protein